MRIVAGKFKGRAIVTPEGRNTRPTSDRARESIFNVLAHAPWAPPLEGARIIDAFAGSGALGFEAISRGGVFCLFVETDSAARGAIRQNVETFQLFGITRIHRRSAVDLGAKPAGVGEPFDLVFLDPPYADDLVPQALAQLAAGDWLAPGALAVAETASADPAPACAGWALLDERTYGAARVSFLTLEDPTAPPARP
jgi:16S rRNA (guanine966-N2)-methyltransferase